MGSAANRLRKKWQTYGGRQATNAEQTFYDVFNGLFSGTEYEIEEKPRSFDSIYVNQPLDRVEASQIYRPDRPITRHGIIPDCLIRNKLTNKTIYIEIKRQDGWVEGKKRSDGRGNAHERLCKYFTPGLLNLLRGHSNIPAPELPFWIVFQGDITRDPCRVREIRFWFANNDKNVFFWRDTRDPNPLVNHFISKIAPLLD